MFRRSVFATTEPKNIGRWCCYMTVVAQSAILFVRWAIVGVGTVFRCGFVTGVSLLVLAGSATAADLPPKVPAQTATYDWIGWYAGGHLGYAWGDSNFTSAPLGPIG